MRRKSIIVFIALAAISAPVQGNLLPRSAPAMQTQEPDSLKAVDLLRRAGLFAEAGLFDSARIGYLEARQICVENHLPYTEALAYEGLASLYDNLEIWDYTLRYKLMAAARYKASYDSLPSAAVYGSIAERYNSFGVAGLAARYFRREYEVYDDARFAPKALSALNTARSYRAVGDTAAALEWFDSARVWFLKAGDERNIFHLNNMVIPLLAEKGENGRALELARWNLEKQPLSDREGMIVLNNNIGFLHFRAGDFRSALERFRRAEEYCLVDPRDDASLAGVYSNMAICYQNLEDEELMFRYFSDALALAENTGQLSEKARIEMLLATIYSDRQDLYNSEIYCVDCISSSRASGNLETLRICYGLYAEVLEDGNDFIKALEYYQKHLSLRDSVLFITRQEVERASERNLYYETIEQNLKLDIADEEMKELELRSQRMELEKQEKELQLLYSEQTRAAVERENLLQSLALSREREEAEKQRQAIRDLEQVRLSQELELEKKAGEERELQSQNQLLASQAREKELELAREQEARRLTLYIAILMVLAAVATLYALVSVRRKNRKLAESKKRIEEINSALEVKNVEISNQKEIIEQKNQSITDSIQYAARIQNAVMLPLTFLSDWGVENFIFFRPKDIVSGDFYWGFRKKGYLCIAAADCTGHGVPGGFMSMLGNAFLNEIVITSEISSASQILDKLRDEIIRALRQRGVTGEARDGMDISLITIDQKRHILQFSGANNPLYLVRRGDLTRYQADRMPIGIHVTDITPFTNHEIQVEPGDVIYLFSDGYADQFGGESGKKFMYKPFQELLTSISRKPMNDQAEILGSTFDNWKKGYDQVDDVLVIGIRIS